MSEPTLEDFLILRNLDEPIPEDAFVAGAKRAVDVVGDMNTEGIAIRWMKSDLRTTTDGAVTGTFCHFQAATEDAIHDHAVRAGLPVTRIDRRGASLENE